MSHKEMHENTVKSCLFNIGRGRGESVNRLVPRDLRHIKWAARTHSATPHQLPSVKYCFRDASDTSITSSTERVWFLYTSNTLLYRKVYTT